ncbi:papain-like cysteine protease family protein [Bacillus cereus group sp. MYBK234-1]|uniref:papain-like cysteine protease family protein n=1 Tax=unclassified Bacillus cereus group TaxID=2750818 RepID=UPI003F79FCFD
MVLVKKNMDKKDSQEEVEFTGITAPLNVNVREGKSLNTNIIDVLSKNTKVTFQGWEIGEAVRDYWTGVWDNRWFYFYKNGVKVFVTSAYINGNPPNPNEQNDLNVSDILQKRSNWCWAGAAISVLNYMGKVVGQDDFVQYVKGGLYNTPATSNEIQYGLSGFGVNSYVYESYQSYEWFQTQINSNQPVIVLIMWKSGGNIGHFVVLDGYYKGTNGTNYIMYMDPWYGDHYNYNFDLFDNNSTFWWEETIYNIRKNDE